MIRSTGIWSNDRLKPRCIWEHVKSDVVQTSDGYIIFDDTILEKKRAEKIALAKHEYSGNARKVVNGIGVVTCVYVNPTLDRSWLIDYRIYCRLARIVRNHIGAALLVWVHLMRKAYETGQTLYQVKHGMLSEYLRQQLKSPMLKINAA